MIVIIIVTDKLCFNLLSGATCGHRNKSHKEYNKIESLMFH